MLTGGLSVISVVVSLMYVHGLYFCCCKYHFLQNKFRIFCLICAYRGVIEISVVVSISVLYVHGCIYFVAYFVFYRTGLWSPEFMLTRLLCVCTCISLLSYIYFKAYVSNYKMIWVFFVPWFWAPLGFYFILFLWVPLLACMTIGNDFVMTLLSFVL